MIAYASSHIEAAESVLARINDAILFPLISLMLSIAVLVFLWGSFQYVYHAEESSEREKGKNNMIYGIIGLLIMLSAYAILQVAAGTFGIRV